MLYRNSIRTFFPLPRLEHEPQSSTALVKVAAATLLSDPGIDPATSPFLSLWGSADDGRIGPGEALIPWICERLVSPASRRAYLGDLTGFVTAMRQRGVEPLLVTGDHIRVYRAALIAAGKSTATVGRVLSVLRGAYLQFGKRGLIGWDQARDIQAVESPRVDRNTTPALTEAEAIRLLHAPATDTLIGLRDHALLFAYFKTACRCAAIASAAVGHIERSDTDHYLVVFEKGRGGKKRQRKALLEAAPAILAYIRAAGIEADAEGPLFRPVAKDRKTLLRKSLTTREILAIVKKYAGRAGIHVERFGGRGVGVHSLRKTALTNALEHGARMEQVQQLAGHSDIRTTQMYYASKERDAEDAARHIQIR